MIGVAERTEADPSEARTRSGALVAGLGLLVMTVAAGAANTRLGQLVVTGDAAGTAAGIAAHRQQFRLIIAGFLITALLDVAVAWGLYQVLAPVHRGAAALSAWLRVGYALVFLALLGHLVSADRLVDGRTGGGPASPGPGAAGQAFHAVTAFQTGWTTSMAVFGLHLAVVGLLAVRSWYVPTWLGALVVLGGIGYIVDGVATAAKAGHDLGLARFTFVGEVLLMIWLLRRGRRLTVCPPHARQP
jgi:hypothetical protein